MTNKATTMPEPVYWAILAGLMASVLGMKSADRWDLLIFQLIGYLIGTGLGWLIANRRKTLRIGARGIIIRVAGLAVAGLLVTMVFVRPDLAWYLILVVQLVANLVGLAIASLLSKGEERLSAN